MPPCRISRFAPRTIVVIAEAAGGNRMIYAS
jgi:hypothetical protein